MKVPMRAAALSTALLLIGIGWGVSPSSAQAADGDLTAPIPTIPAKADLVAISAGRMLASVGGEYQLSADDGATWQAAKLPLTQDCSMTPDCVVHFGTVSQGILPISTSMGRGSWYSLTENKEVGTPYKMGDGEDIQHSNGGFVQLATWDFPNVGDYRVLSMDGTSYPIDAEPDELGADGSLITVQRGETSVVSRTAPGESTPVKLFEVAGAISKLNVTYRDISYYAAGKAGAWAFAGVGNPIGFPVDFDPSSGDIRRTEHGLLVNSSAGQTLVLFVGANGLPEINEVPTPIPDLPPTQDSGAFVGSSVDKQGSYLHWLQRDGSVQVEATPLTIRDYPSGLALTSNALLGTSLNVFGSDDPTGTYWSRPAVSAIGEPVDLGVDPDWYSVVVASDGGIAVQTSDGVRVFDSDGGNPRNTGSPRGYLVRSSGSRFLTSNSVWSAATGWTDRGAIKDIYLDRNLIVTDSADGAVAKVKDLAGTELGAVTFPKSIANGGAHSLWGDWVAADWISGETFDSYTEVTNIATGESYTGDGSLELLGDGFAVLYDRDRNYTLWSFASGTRRSLGDGGDGQRFATDGARVAYTTDTEYVITKPGAAQSLTSTPQPTISGTAEVGATLSAAAGTWEPAGVALSYQWLRNGTAIAGATTQTYQVTESDLGAKLSVAVTGTLAGYSPSTQTSVQVEVAAVALTQTPKPTIQGAALIGQNLSAAAGTWEPAPVELAYRWLRDGTAIEGATAASYLLSESDLGKKISVEVTGSKAGYLPSTQVSDQTEAVGTPGDLPLVATPTPTITGTVRVGETLSAEAGGWEPAPVELTYQWLRDGTAIEGAIGASYVLTADDLGAKLTVAVTGSKAGYLTSAPQTSAATAAVESGVLSATPVPTIDNTLPVADTVLTATAGSWGPGEVSLSYQWYQRSSAGTVVAISGATDPTYQVPGSKVGYRLQVQVTGSMAGGNTVVKGSAWTSAVAKGTFTTAPTPTIYGGTDAGDIYRVGMPLKVEPGTWQPTPDQLKYQWYKVDPAGVASAIGGATTDTYTPTAALEGYDLKVRVAAWREGYTTKTAHSLITPSVAAGMVATTPKLDDTTPKVDQELSVITGDWSEDAELSYQWFARSPTGEVTEIEQADAATYQVPAEYLGYRLKVTVTGRLDGFATTTKTSAYTSAVGKAVFGSSPVPTITGTYRVGQTLTADPAGGAEIGWSPVPDELTYYWYRSGVMVASGVDLNTYALTSLDQGKLIKVKVVAVKAGYTTTPKTSLATPKIGS